jgi:hypothetical protein
MVSRGGIGQLPVSARLDDLHEAFHLGFVPCTIPAEHACERMCAGFWHPDTEGVETPGSNVRAQPVPNTGYDVSFDRKHQG